MSSNQWTFIATVVSAIAAVLGVAWGIYARTADSRSGVRVSLSIGIAPMMPGLILYLLISAANTSHHPVTITTAGLQLSNGKAMTFVDSYPRFPGQLGPGQAVTAFALRDSVTEQLNEMGGKSVWPKRAWVYDATGKRWSCKKKRGWNLGLKDDTQ